jgi:predicted metal-dependent hydrolase
VARGARTDMAGADRVQEGASREGAAGEAARLGERFEDGVRLIRAGAFFEAHEELELAWRAAAPDERDFYQGLVHVAVAWYQAGRGNPVGCRRQLEKAARRLARYAPAHHGLDLATLLDGVAKARRTVAAGSLALEPPRLEGRPRARAER